MKRNPWKPIVLASLFVASAADAMINRAWIAMGVSLFVIFAIGLDEMRRR